MLLVLLLVSSCSKNYPSNKYLGKLPMNEELSRFTSIKYTFAF